MLSKLPGGGSAKSPEKQKEVQSTKLAVLQSEISTHPLQLVSKGAEIMVPKSRDHRRPISKERRSMKDEYIGPDTIIVPITKPKMTKKEMELFMKGYTPVKRRWLNLDQLKKLYPGTERKRG